MIAATDNSASLAAKLATTTIPIVCLVGLDPRWNFDADCFGGLQIDDEFEFDRLYCR